MRPLFYYGGFDNELYNANDEFFWGDEILVAPVLEKRATSRKLYLPKGTWFNLINDSQEIGSTWLNYKVDSTNIPVFVKEGSFIPMFESDHKIESTGDYSSKELTIKYYPSLNESSFTMYDDDGITNNTLAKGKYELLKFEGVTKQGEIHIRISNAYNTSAKSRKLKIVLPAQYKIILRNGKSRSVTTNSYKIEYSGKPVRLIFKIN